MKILANDGLAKNGIKALEQAGCTVLTTTVAQEQLPSFINKNNITVLLVRSATNVDAELIDTCPELQIIGRAGVGLDNIDVAYAQKKGIKIINTPEASSNAVAELVFAHLLSGVRFLYDANRNMPLDGDTKFKELKKSYTNAVELKGKTLGIIGFGRIGQATAKIALGMGMKVMYHNPDMDSKTISLSFFNGESVSFTLENSTKEELLKTADFISLHLPSQKEYNIGAAEFKLMKNGVGIINTARGTLLDEVALIDAMESKKVGFAGLDVFESEPHPEIKILMNPNISLSPHMGGSTLEAQDRIALELANQIIDFKEKS